MLHSEITEKIIKAFFKVYNTLGYGFLEKVYENALVIELQKMGFNISQQHNIKVYYDMKMVGDYYADIIIDDNIIIELKAAESLKKEHKSQLINYLKATEEARKDLKVFPKAQASSRCVIHCKKTGVI